MLFFLRAWGLRSSKIRSAFDSDVDDLILLFGANAYEEARRRKLEADDLATARYWGAVKSELGRRIIEVCDKAELLDRIDSTLFAEDAVGYAILDPASENRGTSRGLAGALETCESGRPEKSDARRAKERGALANVSRSVLRSIARQKKEISDIISFDDRKASRTMIESSS